MRSSRCWSPRNASPVLPRKRSPPHLVRGYYAANRTHVGLATYLAALGITAFTCFVMALRRTLAPTGGTDGILPQIACAGGLGVAALALVSDCFLATLAFRASSMDTQTAWILFTLWNMAVSMTAFPAAILVGATSLAIVRNRVLTRWLVVLGFPLAIALLIAPTSAHHTSGPLVYGGDFWLPLVAAFLLWVLGISLTLGYPWIHPWQAMTDKEPHRPASGESSERRRDVDRGPEEPERKTILSRRRHLLFLITILLGGLAVARGPVCTTVRPLLLLAEVFPGAPIKPLGLITPRPTHEVVRFPSTHGPVVADLYLPRPWLGGYPVHSRPALVLALGVTVGPDAKQAVRRFAEAVSRLGYVTLWPRRAALDRGAAQLEQPATFVAAFRYAERVQLVDPRRISFFGFSAGASEAFVAATDPRIARLVHTVIFFGGYYDLPAYLASLATHRITVGGRETAWQPAPAFIAELKTVLRNSHEKRLLKLFAARTAAAAFGIIDDGSRRQQALLHQLSPSSRVRAFRSTIFILHDKGDPIVPWVESRKLAQVLPKTAVRGILFSSLFRHVVPGGDGWRTGLLQYVRLYRFVASVLNYL